MTCLLISGTLKGFFSCGLAVQIVGLDVGNNSLGTEVVKRQATPDPMAEFAGTDLDQMAIATMKPESGDIRRLLGRMPGPIEKDELNQPSQFGDVFPQVHPGQLVAADDPEQLIIGKKRPEMPDRVDRVANASALQFDV
jgi:hypothetical protein